MAPNVTLELTYIHSYRVCTWKWMSYKCVCTMIQKESTTDSGHYTSCNCYCTSCSYHFEICSCYCATCSCHCSKLQLLLHQLQLSLWNLQLSVCNLQMSLHKYSWYCIVSSCHYETISCIVPVAAVNVHLHTSTTTTDSAGIWKISSWRKQTVCWQALWRCSGAVWHGYHFVVSETIW